jgi:hypothetical protein
MIEKSDKKAVIRIQLDENAKLQLDDLCRRRGMTHIAIMSRLVGWFCKQDDLIQASVLSMLEEEVLAPLARRMLQRLANGDVVDKKSRTTA